MLVSQVGGLMLHFSLHKNRKEVGRKENSSREFIRDRMEVERGVRVEAKESIAERLSLMEDLYFPRALQPSAGDPTHRKSLFLDLLSRDVAVFLERYGSLLTSDELREFDTLNGDYEINWHLKHLRSKNSPTSEELRSRSVTVKNRRRAYLDRLICDGQYFSEDAMREREPYLHHEYVGKFQDPSGRSMARPGERWSETLLRRWEEARLVAEIREEQQRLGVAERDWVGNEVNQQEAEEEEEEEEDEDEEDNEKREEEKGKLEQEAHSLNGAIKTTEVSADDPSEKVSSCSSRLNNEDAMPSEEEMQDRMDLFTHIMHQKFLSGEDHQHLDYTKIDDDEALDDHWLKEANYDAEERYFAED